MRARVLFNNVVFGPVRIHVHTPRARSHKSRTIIISDRTPLYICLKKKKKGGVLLIGNQKIKRFLAFFFFTFFKIVVLDKLIKTIRRRRGWADFTDGQS